MTQSDRIETLRREYEIERRLTDYLSDRAVDAEDPDEVRSKIKSSLEDDTQR